MILNRNLSLITAACLLVSCTTVATKKPEIKPTTAAAAGKKGKRVGGMTSSKGPATQTLPAAPTVQTADPMANLKKLVMESITAPTKPEQESYRLQAIEIVDNKLNEKQLEEVADNSDYGYLRGNAMYRLGEKALEARDASKAKKYFTGVIEYLPGSDLAARSQDIISQLEATRNVEAKTVGVVLPLSGKNAPVGQRALRGLEMGLGLNLPGSSFKLAVMDSEGNPDSARRGVERLVKEDNVIAVVGSLLSKTAPAVAAKSDELGVPSIALSQRSGLTEIGPTVFRNSLTSEMQVRYLVRTAMDDLGMKKFAILYPNDQYGIEFSNIFWDEVLARGGQVTAVQTYSTKETDFRLVIQRLVGTYYGEARQDEFNLRLKEMQKSDKKRSARKDNVETILPPVTDFDGIFIPDSAKSLGQIAAMLAFNDVRGVKLMGTNLWNTPGLAKRAGNFANNLMFVDSLAPNTQEQSRFVNEYKSLYNESPSLIEIQAYDAGLILRQLIASGADSRQDLVKKLTELKKFPGALGPLSMSPDREIERPVTALTVEKGEITPLKVRK
ncbi:penicillin-binding protein activator [Bdellovibrio svalbardensis]|uniref:Penicillin-binding protein activator n=1 Tax=Bdellovibrio svalbardensis TaxID=2972972 RepID=A0ABT6DDQ8_9BACT|nr:penicillin-binding protein activator [Bdellovibrio svalbardensis]MDG0814971.1 penicillin-binding protein activator [Bdellovibrio svalbardensis]